MSDDLVTWLRAQLDDDERVARASANEGDGQWRLADYQDGTTTAWHGEVEVMTSIARADADHLARHDPARVLAEVDAKRRILDVYKADVIDASKPGGPAEWVHGAVPVEAHTVLRLLALPYADRPGYRNEWKP